MLEKVFLSYHFDDEAMLLASKIETMIRSFGLKVISGEHLAGAVLHNKIEEDIKEADALIYILSKREEGKTNDWVMHEVSTAKNLKKPFFGLIEKGINAPAHLGNREVFFYDNIDSSFLWIKLSHTLNNWKSKKGRIIRGIIQPEDIASELRSRQNIELIRVRYREIDSRFDVSGWKDAKIKKTKAGVSVLLSEVKNDTSIELEISDGNNTWSSIPIDQNLIINVS